MSNLSHIEFFKAIIQKSLIVLEKDCNQSLTSKKTNLFPKNIDHSCYIQAIEIEEFNPNSEVVHKKNKLHRVYVQSEDPTINSVYIDVGWILLKDAKVCMLCNNPSGILLNCHACGNAVCTLCSDTQVFVHELPNLPSVRVCKGCGNGQVHLYILLVQPYLLPLASIMIRNLFTVNHPEKRNSA